MEALTFDMSHWNIVELNPDHINLQGMFLWVFNADKKPPHIGISMDHKYYSLKAGGIDEGISTETITNLIEQKDIPVLIVELIFKDDLNVGKVFMEYETTIPYKTTCLVPIKRLLQIEEADTIHDLLTVLQERKQVGQVLSKNLPSDYSGIPYYTLEDIHLHLSSRSL